MSQSKAETTPQEANYLTNGQSISSWLLTTDHKRIALLYLITISALFALGGVLAGLIRLHLIQPGGTLFVADTYNRVFTLHGVVMIFFFLIPSIPAVMGNFLVPIMIGAKDLAFPRLNLLSWYLFIIGAVIALWALISGGVDTGWTFYTPYSSTFSKSQVVVTLVGLFITGFSSIATGVNFIVTIHKMRAPGMTWFRLPLFIWALYATSIIIILGTPVIAITLLLVVFERVLGLPIFDPALGGDPLLFQHLFWFYSHPAVYIMILPAMGVISEIITCFCSRQIFGYKFIAYSSILIALLGFMVWGHHMFTTAQSLYAGMVFSVITFLVAIPSAIKIFNWMGTMYKGHIRLTAPMLYALGFMGLFTIGGLTGLFLASLATDIHFQDTYFVVAHFHYVMVGGAIMAFLGGLHFWWSKMTGKTYPEKPAQIASIMTFIGFNLTFFPQFLLGYLGMPRRYATIPVPEWIYLHQWSTMGAVILGLGYAMPVFYLTYSLFKGAKAEPNPWNAKGLEWNISSPPTTYNFDEIPTITEEPYDYHPSHKEADSVSGK